MLILATCPRTKLPQVESVLPFQHFFAICGREDGLERVWLATKDDTSDWRPFARTNQGLTKGERRPNPTCCSFDCAHIHICLEHASIVIF